MFCSFEPKVHLTRAIAYLCILLVPLALVMLSLGAIYAVLGAAIFVGYCLTLSFPTILRSGLLLEGRSLATTVVVAIVALGYVRAVMAGSLGAVKTLALITIWVMLALGFPSWRRLGLSADAAWRSVQAYVVINVVGLLVRVPTPANAYSETGGAKLLGLLGLDVHRALFPFALGVNGFGVLAGLSVIISTVYYFLNRSWADAILVICSVCALLLSDSRGAVGFTLLTLVALGFAYAVRHSKAFRELIAITLVGLFPFLTLIVLKTISYLLGDLSSLVRSGGGILSGREVIWDAVYESLSSFSLLHWLFGWGYFGQIQSHASKGYERLFVHLQGINPEAMSVHSSALQLILDFGVVGLGFIMWIALARVRYSLALFDEGRARSRILIFAFICYGVLAGSVDLTINENNLVFFYLFLVVSAWRLIDSCPVEQASVREGLG